jgi:hypothetical protein
MATKRYAFIKGAEAARAARAIGDVRGAIPSAAAVG